MIIYQTSFSHWFRFGCMIMRLFSDSSSFVHSEYWFFEVFYLFYLVDRAIFRTFQAVGMLGWQLFWSHDPWMLLACAQVRLECAFFWYLFGGEFLFFCSDVVLAQFIQKLVPRLGYFFVGLKILPLPAISLHGLIFQSLPLPVGLLPHNLNLQLLPLVIK